MAKSNRTEIARVCDQCGITFLATTANVNRRNVRFCGTDCYHKSRIIPIDVQFRRGIGMTTATGCILWAGLTDHNGYGIIYSTTRPPQRIFLAHRIAWELNRSPIPKGVCVLHNCPGGDNPLCVNVEHLFLGTQLENIDDMARKGRSPNRRLTDEQIRTVRARYAAGGVSQQRLADEFGVHQTCISSIVRGAKWKYVE
jgi:hypothetical protein